MACDWLKRGRERKTAKDEAAPVPPVSWSPRVIPVTNASDGLIAPRMMSDRANAFIQGGNAFVFCGTSDGPRFFGVNLATGEVSRLGPLVPYGGECEGWYFTPTGLLVLPSGPRLLRLDPFISPSHVEVLLDVSDMPGHDLWQPSSADDGLTHAATVRQIVESGKYPYVGTVIQGPHGRRFEATRGELDESQVTRSGSHVVIEEKVDGSEDNRIINLATGEVWDLADADGAIAHSDCGPDYIVGEANLPGPGRCVKLDPHMRERTDLFFSDNVGYISVRNGVCLNSDDTHISLVSLTGAGRVPLVALDHPANRNDADYYDQRAKVNLDASASVACYMDGGVVKLLVL